MSEDQKELAKVIEKYFGADAGYLDIDCFTLARRIIEAGWTKPVRCKDCIYNEKISCMFGEFCNPHYRPDYFCSDGVRRDEE